MSADEEEEQTAAVAIKSEEIKGEVAAVNEEEKEKK